MGIILFEISANPVTWVRPITHLSIIDDNSGGEWSKMYKIIS
jgi:hypothetical protein